MKTEHIIEFDVYFELYGKKMKATIIAPTEEQAKELVREKIIFHKVKEKNSDWNDIIGMMKGMKNDIN